MLHDEKYGLYLWDYPSDKNHWKVIILGLFNLKKVEDNKTKNIYVYFDEMLAGYLVYLLKEGTLEGKEIQLK